MVNKWQNPFIPPSIFLFFFFFFNLLGECDWLLVPGAGRDQRSRWVGRGGGKVGQSSPIRLILEWEGKQRLPRQQLAGEVGHQWILFCLFESGSRYEVSGGHTCTHTPYTLTGESIMDWDADYSDQCWDKCSARAHTQSEEVRSGDTKWCRETEQSEHEHVFMSAWDTLFYLLLQIGKPVYYDTKHLCLISKLLLLYSVITPRKCVWSVCVSIRCEHTQTEQEQRQKETCRYTIWRIHT